MTHDPEYFHADGRRKNTEERQRYRQQQADQQRHAERLAASVAAPPPVENHWRKDYEELKRRGPGPDPRNLGPWKKRLVLLKQKADEFDAKRKAEKDAEEKQADIDANPIVKDMRELVESRLRFATDDERIELQQAGAYLNEGLTEEAGEIVDCMLNAQLDRLTTAEHDALGEASKAVSAHAEREAETAEVQRAINTRGTAQT